MFYNPNKVGSRFLEGFKDIGLFNRLWKRLWIGLKKQVVSKSKGDDILDDEATTKIIDSSETIKVKFKLQK